MTNPTDVVEQIKAKLDIVQVVSDYVELKKAGRNFKGLSPFKKERTPSFIVSPDKQLAFCFATQRGGDMFTFIMEVENVDFKGAIAHLAEKAGVEYTPSKSGTKTHSNKASKKEIYYDIMSVATSFFEEQLTKHKHAHEYFTNRGLSKEIITQYQLGYAPNSFDDLWKHLRDSGFASSDIEQVGLLSQKNGKYFNKFRDRVMFPIRNNLGKVVAFAGRVLSDAEPKYLNSPESPIYHKSAIIYGLDTAKEHIRTRDEVLVVEGYMDVLAMAEKGIFHAVAVCGTAFTEEQFRILLRSTSNILLMFDRDAAGWEATKRNSIMLIKDEHIPNVVSFDDKTAKDVDEYLQNHTKEDLLTCAKQARSFFDILLDHTIRRIGTETVSDRLSIAKEYLSYLREHPSIIAQEEYTRDAALKIGLRPESMYAELRRLTPKQSTAHTHTASREQPKTTEEQMIAGILLQYPHLYTLRESKLAYVTPVDTLCSYLLRVLRGEVSFEDQNNEIDVISLLHEDYKDQANVLLLQLEREELLENEVIAAKTLDQNIAKYLKKKKAELVRSMHEFEQAKDPLSWKKSYDELLSLRKLSQK